MNLTETKLLKKKQEIEDNKTKLIQLKADYNAQLKALKSTYGYGTLEEARSALEKMKEDLIELDGAIEALEDDVVKKYFQDED